MELHSSRAFRSPRSAPLGLAIAILLASAAWTRMAVAQDFSEPLDVQVDLGQPHVRFGVSGVGGGFAGVVDGFSAGVAPRVGVQLDQHLAVYLQMHGLIGNVDRSAGGNRVVGFFFNEIMFDVTLLDRFQIGLGPSLDFAWNCPMQQDGVRSCANGNGRFGGDLRLALALGDQVHGTDGRSGAVISLEVHPTWLDPEFTWMMLVGVGGETF